jgi:outer membrane protease
MDNRPMGEELIYNYACLGKQCSSVIMMSKVKAAKACNSVLVYENSFDYSYIYLDTMYTQQSFKVSNTFPYKWINKKWRDSFYVTSMTTTGSRWAVVVSHNAGFSD